jgi:uncharacterized protein (UPF0332 family)
VIEPKDLFDQAVKLFAAASDDLGYRLVIERAYYGAYHASSAFEEHLAFRSNAQPKKGTHDALLQRLEQPHPQLAYALQITSKELGAQLRMFKGLRELATYELKETIRVDQAELAIRTAKDILEECAKIRK